METSSEASSAKSTGGPFDPAWSIRGGALAGAVATVVMGLAITGMNLDTLRLAIAGLYGQAGNVFVGWIVHLVHGSIFGIVFAGVLADPGFYRLTRWRWKTVVVGAVFGLLLAIVGAGFVMPVWLDAAGFEQVPPVPNVTTDLLLWHVLYGVVLGAVFPTVE